MMIHAGSAGQVCFRKVETYLDREDGQVRVLRPGGGLEIVDAAGHIIQHVPLHPADRLLVADGAAVAGGEALSSGDHWCERVLAELPAGVPGTVRWDAGLLCDEFADEVTGLVRRRVRRPPAARSEGPAPGLRVEGAAGTQQVCVDPGDLIQCVDGAQVLRGDALVVRLPPNSRSADEPGGGLSRLAMLLDPPRPCDQARLALFDGRVTLRRDPDGWHVQVRGEAGEQEIRAMHRHAVVVNDGDDVAAGDALTQGSRCHRELRRVLGVARYGEHLARELERVFALTTEPIDTRVLDLLAREQTERLGRKPSG